MNSWAKIGYEDATNGKWHNYQKTLSWRKEGGKAVLPFAWTTLPCVITTPATYQTGKHC